MKIKTICEITGLTDRTIRYYIEEQLLSPTYTENYLGRKSFTFSQKDIDTLKNISILRKFNFTIEEIKRITDNTENSKAIIQNVKARSKQALDEEQIRQSVLSKINDERSYTVEELASELSAASERLLTTEEKPKIELIKTMFAITKTILTFIVVWLPVTIQFFFFFVTILIYAYPEFPTGTKVYILLSVLPSVLVLLLNKIQKDWRKTAKKLLLTLCVLSSLFAIPIGFLPAGLMAKSETTDIVQYRDFDADCTANTNSFFQALFPKYAHYFIDVKQPDGHYKTVYLDSHYYYRFMLGFDYTYDIYAQWPLEKAIFDKEVDRVKELFDSSEREYTTMQNGKYTCFIIYDGDPPFEEATDNYTYYIFAYDETNLVVRYITSISLDDGAEQPFYLSLDW